MAWERNRRSMSEMGLWAFLTHNLSFAILTIIAVFILVLGRSDGSLLGAVRTMLQDGISPVFEWIAGPSNAVTRWTEGAGAFFDTYAENQRLREENAALLAVKNEAIELRQKVQRYEALLNTAPHGEVAAVTARVLADASGSFAHSLIVNAGREQGVTRGQAVSSEQGLIGHVVHTGMRSSRVLLLKDMGSRIPVRLERANVKAILAGDNSSEPFLEFLPRNAVIVAGDRVITAADGGVFPPGVPVGVVADSTDRPRVDLFADERRADFVRILNYTVAVDVDRTPAEPIPGKPKLGPEPPVIAPPIPPVIAAPAGPALPETRIGVPLSPGPAQGQRSVNAPMPAPQRAPLPE